MGFQVYNGTQVSALLEGQGGSVSRFRMGIAGVFIWLHTYQVLLTLQMHCGLVLRASGV